MEVYLSGRGTVKEAPDTRYKMPGVFELIIRIRLLRSFQVKDGIRYYNYAACAD